MSNRPFDAYPAGAYDGLFSWTSDTVHAYLIDTTLYTFDASHQFLVSIPSGARIAGPISLAGKSISGRTLQATSPVTFPTVPIGPDVKAIVLVQSNGSDATDRLMIWIDTAFGLPGVLDGLDVRISWSTGTNKIMRI